MSWRKYIDSIFIPTILTDVYQFGVYTGESMYDMVNILNKRNVKIRKLYGFDSFIGLPEETLEPIYQECWNKGGFNASEKLNASNVEECISKIDNIVKSNSDCSLIDIQWIAGFFDDTLKDSIVQDLDMQPALYVDLDADLYSSTLTALDFMCRNKLIVPGTILGYDDWGGTPNWMICKDGESRAHIEICKRYGLVCEKICQIGTMYPHVQMVFQVRDIL